MEKINGVLTIGQNDMEFLSKSFGTAFYLFYADKFDSNYKNLIEKFTKYYDKFQIAYSCKTNYLPQCLKIVLNNGGYAEVVSDMELEIAHRSGFKDNRIIWNGPVKNYQILDKFLLNGGLSNIDNLDEWNHVKEIASNNKSNTFRIGIRCCFDTGDGVISRFGIDTKSDEFQSILWDIAKSENIELVSLQCHFAKRKSCYWGKRTSELLKIYGFIKNEYGLSPKILDLGGGISGIMTKEFSQQIGSTENGPDGFAEKSASLVYEYFKDFDDKPLLLTEPGTALAADSMSIVLEVQNIRCVRSKWIATVNGSQKNISMNNLNPPIHVIHMNKTNSKMFENLDIAGYTCIESDYLYKGYKGKLAVGDIIVLDYCGSYSLVCKPPFISPNIPVVGIRNNDIQSAVLLKNKESNEDVIKTYNIDISI